jgi:oligoendopeptidase F
MHDTRDDIDPEYRFDLTRIFPTRDAWADECDALARDVDDFGLDRPLAELLPAFESLSARDYRLRTYAGLRADVATDDDQRAADRTRAESLHSDVMAVRDDVEREIRERASDRPGDRDVDESAGDRAGELPERFERYVADVRRRGEHTLPPDAADLLSSLDGVLDAPKRVHRALVDRDFEPPTIDAADDPAVDGESVTLARSERGRIQREADRNTRKRAFRAVRDAFRERRATLAANLDTMARRNVRLADARGYDSALAAALHGDESHTACRPRSQLPREVYDALVGGVRDNLAPKHRLERVRRDALGVDELRPWDRNAVPVDGDAPRYEFSEAQRIVLEAVEPLGEPYQSRLQAIFDERRIDAFDHQGKTEHGAGYATTAPGAGPFVLTRWNGTLSHLFLLAHELGHAVQFSLVEDAQPHVTAGIPQPTSELASKLHEILLADHLLDTTTGAERTVVAARAVRSVGSNLFYSSRWAAFTHRLHERVGSGDRLTADWLDETYGDLYAEFNPVVEPTERLRAGWTTGLYNIPLYHHYPYILGTAGALAVVDGLGDDITPADYVEFLEAGTSELPVALLDDLGVDATSEQAVGRAVSRFDDYVDALATACRG